MCVDIDVWFLIRVLWDPMYKLEHHTKPYTMKHFDESRWKQAPTNYVLSYGK